MRFPQVGHGRIHLSQPLKACVTCPEFNGSMMLLGVLYEGLLACRLALSVVAFGGLTYCMWIDLSMSSGVARASGERGYATSHAST